ncbi:histo-blood group ABO system transferase-like isoform X1 [Rattus norvegicus]|uniref:histo-blood group ABO system transferase-like isoform X1 n=1 Tax=Rattus norvegicus TaxID=10116 RepID=UPI0003D084B4|nr:histo-blood group ABO system transferase-like isoform X1 [Rattus norvegicus]|eukprot:XP_008757480.1 PREDICTED: histo-blood group ABO system transferase-like isoform X1 [Rattus norvegicus]
MLYYPSKLIVPSRANIAIQTPWLAPIVWDRTFQIGILNQQFWLQNVSIGLVVFTTGACIAFLKVLLQTSETYFMQGHRVKYYPFNGQPASLPTLKPCKGRQMVILEIQASAHQLDTYVCRVEMISHLSQHHFVKEVDYLVCVCVNIIFCHTVGVKVLSSLFDTLHPLVFGLPRKSLAYERQPQPQAYISEDEGAFFGGKVLEIYRLTKFHYQAVMMDQAHYIEVMKAT